MFEKGGTNMFGVLARERRKKEIDATHNRIIRECVLDVDEDEETGEISVNDVGLLVDLDDSDESDLTPEENQVIDEIIKNKDVENMSNEELNSLASHIMEKLKSINKDDCSDCK